MDTLPEYILTLRCHDQIGIVAAVTTALANSEAFIVESEHYGDEGTGLYRLQVSAEGGTGDSSLYILETSYQYQKEVVSGFVQTPAQDIAFDYACEWLSPTATITTNSQNEDVSDVQNRAKAFVSNLDVQIIRNKPDNAAPIGTVLFPVFGLGIDKDSIIISGSSVEKAGGLYRVRASATKGQLQQLV